MKLVDILSQLPQYGANEAAVECDSKTNVRYIRITDITDDGQLNDDFKTANNIEEKYLLKQNDLLFARSGATAGKAFLYKEQFGKAIFAGYLIRFKINEAKALAEYVFILTQLQFYKDWVKSIQRPSGQPNINSEEFKNLEIPLPPLATQQKIVALMQAAQQSKTQQQQQAQALLNSIDSYVLEQLGITLPTIKEDKKCFVVRKEEVVGKRLDVNYNHPLHKANISAIKNGKFELVTLKDITQTIFQGVGKNEDDTSSHYLLKVKNIKQNYIIDYDDIETIGDFSQNKVLKKGDIITPCIGEAVRQIKFCSFNNEENRFLVDNNVGVIRLSEKANSNYITFCLCNSIGRIQIDQFIAGGGVPFVGAENLGNFQIPLPPLSIQQSIATEVQKRISQAQQLQSQALQQYAAAKQQIEQMIMGD